MNLYDVFPVAIFFVAIVITIALGIAERIKERKLLNRSCCGWRWRRRFPGVPSDDIRDFLSLFTAAFSFDEKHRLKFSPDDCPCAIYDACYVPHLTIDDHNEFELLRDALKATYGIDLDVVWRDDLTLGELFLVTRRML